MGIIDLGSGLNFVASSPPALQTSGGYAEACIDLLRRGIISPGYEHMAGWGVGFSACTATSTLTSTNETPIFLMSNPSASGRIVKMLSMSFIAPLSQTFLIVTTQTSLTFRFYLNSTVGAVGSGTATPVGKRQTGQNSASTLIYTAPTITTLKNLIMTRTANSTAAEDLVVDFKSALLLDPGSNLVVTAQATAANVVTTVSAEYAEMTA